VFRVGFYQFAPEFGKVSRNLAKVIGALRGVKADLIVLPELPFTGYYFQDRAELAALAESPAESPTVSSLVALCRENDCFLVTGFAEKARDKIFNSALLVGPTGILHAYRKLHLFSTEKEYFDAGDTPLETSEVRGTKVGMMVCFDWIFPEVARCLALKGADLICHPSNLVLPHCQEAMRTRCLENGVFAVTANRFGSDSRPRGALSFTGQSQIVSPKGKVLHRSKTDAEELFVTEIVPAEARSKSVPEKNDLLADRRAEFYSDITNRERR